MSSSDMEAKQSWEEINGKKPSGDETQVWLEVG
jgi:hypothetical protein